MKWVFNNVLTGVRPTRKNELAVVMLLKGCGFRRTSHRFCPIEHGLQAVFNGVPARELDKALTACRCVVGRSVGAIEGHTEPLAQVLEAMMFRIREMLDREVDGVDFCGGFGQLSSSRPNSERRKARSKG